MSIPSCSVIVPFRADSPERVRAWEWCRRYWEARGFPVIQGEPAGSDWCKAEAVDWAIGRATTRYVAVADADVFCDGIEIVLEALERWPGRRWGIPHHTVYRLDAQSSENVLEVDPAQVTHPAHGLIHTFDEYPYPGHPGGGMVILKPDSYHQAPMDRRFLGWGHEDDAWALALGVLLGPAWRGVAPMYHLWHPPQPRPSRLYGSDESVEVYAEYRRRRRDVESLREWVFSGRASVTPAGAGRSVVA